MDRLTKDYCEILREALQDPEEALAYLRAVLNEGDRATWLLALRDVADAHGLRIRPLPRPVMPCHAHA